MHVQNVRVARKMSYLVRRSKLAFCTPFWTILKFKSKGGQHFQPRVANHEEYQNNISKAPVNYFINGLMFWMTFSEFSCDSPKYALATPEIDDLISEKKSKPWPMGCILWILWTQRVLMWKLLKPQLTLLYSVTNNRQ